MATKSKLEQAVAERAAGLNRAQRELVLSQFADYKRNLGRIAEIDDAVRLADRILLDPARAGDDALIRRREMLVSERSQLSVANNGIASSLFVQLGGGNAR